MPELRLRSDLTRRQLVQGLTAAAGAAVLSSRQARAEEQRPFAAQPPSGFVPMVAPGRVAKVTAKGDLKESMQPNQRWPKLEVARKLLHQALMGFTNAPNEVEALKRFIHKDDIVAIKINGIAAQTGYSFGTNYELILAVVETLLKVGVAPERINVFEQTWGYLQGCRVGVQNWKLPVGVRRDSHDNKKMGTPKIRMYQGLTTQYCTALTEATAVINMPLLKDHGICGYTGALKNITHGCINNPSHFHAHQASPQIAILYNHPIVTSRVRLHITDGFRVMYDGGPLDRNKRAQILHGSVYVATDPVAMDTLGAKAVDEHREANRLPNLKKSRREPRYLQTASEFGLGVHDLNDIRLQSSEA